MRLGAGCREHSTRICSAPPQHLHSTRIHLAQGVFLLPPVPVTQDSHTTAHTRPVTRTHAPTHTPATLTSHDSGRGRGKVELKEPLSIALAGEAGLGKVAAADEWVGRPVVGVGGWVVRGVTISKGPAQEVPAAGGVGWVTSTAGCCQSGRQPAQGARPSCCCCCCAILSSRQLSGRRQGGRHTRRWSRSRRPAG